MVVGISLGNMAKSKIDEELLFICESNQTDSLNKKKTKEEENGEATLCVDIAAPNQFVWHLHSLLTSADRNSFTFLTLAMVIRRKDIIPKPRYK